MTLPLLGARGAGPRNLVTSVVQAIALTLGSTSVSGAAGTTVTIPFTLSRLNGFTGDVLVELLSVDPDPAAGGGYPQTFSRDFSSDFA